ncbi:MAG: type IV secretion system protein [bacterium]
MKIGKQIGNNLNKFYSALDVVIAQPVKEAKGNYVKIYKKDRIKAIFLLIAFVLIIALSILFSVWFFNNDYPTSTQTNLNEFNSMPLGQSSEQKTVVTSFLESYKATVQLFTPIFDGFVTSTADPTGKSQPSGNGFSYNPVANNNTEFYSGATVRPATYYSNKLLVLVTPLLVVLIVIQGFNFINGEKPEELKSFIYRVLYTVALIILTPQILSLSLIGSNLLTRYLTDGKPVTQFMVSFLDKIQQNYQSNTQDQIVTVITTITTGGTSNIVALIQSLPIILPFILILLLFLYISFQFILRFLNLYFLTAIYPFTTVFAIHPKTQGIASNYWKQWVSFLIHQPVFVLGYVIVQELLFDMLDKGASIEQILIFLAMLLFLSTINMVSSRIWGDVYTALSTNIQSAIGAGVAKNMLYDKPKAQVSGMSQSFKSGALGGLVNNFSSFAGRKTGEKLGTVNTFGKSSFGNAGGSGITASSGGKSASSSGLKVQHTALEDGTKSFIAQGLSESGYNVTSSDPTNGVISTGGSFYANSESDQKGLSTLYMSKSDAKLDGVKESAIKEVSIPSMSVRDTSNKLGTQEYNRKVGKFAKDKGIKSKVHLNQSTSGERVATNLKVARGLNQAQNVHGVVVKRFANNAPKGDPNGRITKFYVYNELLKGEQK